MTSHTETTPIILVPGHWLGAWAWDEVVEHLAAAGCRASALTLPGLDPADQDRAKRTLTDQVAALDTAVRACGAPVTLVAHSGANGPVTTLLDRSPELVERVVWVDSGPVGDGLAFAPDFPEDLAGLPLPEFDALGEQASLAGLSEATLDRFRERAVAEPAGVLREPVRLGNDARYEVPTTFVCCSLASAQVRELATAGHPMFAEISRLTDARYVDLATGHWPMWSRPRELAEIIAAEVGARPAR
ncbi:hypothetical protein ACIFOC_01819 [Leucobacter aridicollis]|uniref:alpha/beta fold hydrolase n=1 Tax=Leucobacter aridicollis TaxID=283878 RepID=UPI0037CC946F